MAHFPKPFFKRSRNLWYVEIDRRQVNLGSKREEAFRRYHELMGQSRLRPVAGLLLVEVIDRFLEWVKRERAPDTYEWYRYRLQRLSERHSQLKLVDLRPFTIQEWVDEYPALSKTSRRNYVRSIKACLDLDKRRWVFPRAEAKGKKLREWST